MKCPKCGETRLQINHTFDSYVYCKLCDTYYTEWQQAEIERQQERIEELEAALGQIAELSHKGVPKRILLSKQERQFRDLYYRSYAPIDVGVSMGMDRAAAIAKKARGE